MPLLDSIAQMTISPFLSLGIQAIIRQNWHFFFLLLYCSLNDLQSKEPDTQIEKSLSFKFPVAA